MRRLVRSFPLVASLLLALVMSGCLGSFHLPGSSNDSFTGGVPDRPKVLVPATDAELPPHVPRELIVALRPGDDIAPIAEALGATVLDSLPPLNAHRLLLDTDASITDAIRSLEHHPAVRYSEPNYADVELHDAFVPNDPAFSAAQWGPQKIGAPEAWAAGYTGKDIIIAIIDTGVDADHPDLVGRVLLGANTPDGNYDTRDLNGHGTMVAGVAAASTNNGIGMSGIAGDAYIFPIKVFPDSSPGTNSYHIAWGMLIAAMPSIAGLPYPPADVANLSLGGVGYSVLMQDAVQFAIEQNVVVVTSGGNSYKQGMLFPAGYQGVIAVAATDPWDERASFSTQGPHISVAAPGYMIYSTSPGGAYRRASGTSLSAPHVAGAAALIRQKYPGMSPLEVRHLLEQSADSPEGFTRALGHGRINIPRALNLQTDYTRTTLKVTVKASDGTLMQDADVLLMRGDVLVGNARTGGVWVIEGEPFSSGMAVFHYLVPGKGYRLSIRLYEAAHGVDFLHFVEELELGDVPVNEIEVVLPDWK